MSRSSRAAVAFVGLVFAGACDQKLTSQKPIETAPSAATARPTAAAQVPDAAAPAVDMQATIAFKKEGTELRTISLAEMAMRSPPETFTAYDPYYNKPKQWRAIPLRDILTEGFSGTGIDLEKEDFVLRARDGYTVPIRGAVLSEPGAYIAIEDVDVPGWEPIGPQRANPAPFYLVWKEKNQQSTDRYPRPWQLSSIEIARFENTFPHVIPGDLPETSLPMRGLAIFREQCIHCHAINREGGRVGPDLNVPKSIVEYRPEPQIRAYIKNPLSFRYGTMPAHPNLKETDLDALIGYFQAMRSRKHDPDEGGKPH